MGNNTFDGYKKALKDLDASPQYEDEVIQVYLSKELSSRFAELRKYMEWNKELTLNAALTAGLKSKKWEKIENPVLASRKYKILKLEATRKNQQALQQLASESNTELELLTNAILLFGINLLYDLLIKKKCDNYNKSLRKLDTPYSMKVKLFSYIYQKQ